MNGRSAVRREDVVPSAALRPYLADLHARWLHEQPGERYRSLTGTLVFADVSGFTPLTERLARRGRVGAESLTDVLNDVFSALLSVASEHGGDLLKFGGDALLLLFDDSGHERQACAAAVAMQTALRPWRRFTTEAGSVSLRMSVGIAAGKIHAFLVGDSHRELLVGGKVVSRVVALESAADAGEILVDDAVAGALGVRELGPAKEPGHLLRRAPAAERPIRRPTQPARVELGVPVALRGHLSRRVDDGEHRQAVLTFVQFKGLDRLLSSAGTTAATDALDELVRRVQRACDEHGVCFLATDLDGDGGKILLVAGAPSSSADDADRTLVTLLETVAVPSPLVVRAGVNAGPAFAVDVGSATRRTYAVMGDATNLAARVVTKATAGQVVATTAALARTRSPFDHEPLPPFTVKGKSQPVSAAVVVGARETSAGNTSRLVGRDRERQQLAALSRNARHGRGGVLTLVGEAGLGKSALVEYFRSLVPDLPQLVCAAAPYAAVSPYFAVRAPLRRLLGVPAVAGADTFTAALVAAAPALAGLAPLLGVVFGVEVPDTEETRTLATEFRRARAHAAVQDLLHALLPGPAVIVVEDAHWLDEASATLLGGLAANARDHKWAVLITRRPADGVLDAAAHGEEIVLAPLSADESQILAATALGEVPAHVRGLLAERSGGNPFLLLELLDATRLGADAQTLPDTLESVVAARIDALLPDERALVRHAAVLGHRFTSSLLAAVMTVDEADITHTLSRLNTVVVAENGGYRFAHALLRDAAYAALPFRQRRILHARAGRLIEHRAGDEVAEWSDLLSLHFEQAQEHKKTWKYARLAAERARAQWAPAEACTLYQRAVRAGRALDIGDAEMACVYEELGDCAELAGRYTDAGVAYREARSRVSADVVRAADLCRKEGWVRERSGRYSAAVRWYRRGSRVLAGHEEGQPSRARLALAEGAARLRQGRYRDALPLLHLAVGGATAHADEATLAHAYYLLDWAYTDLGSDEALHYRELSLPIYERLGNLGRQGVVFSNLGIDAYFEGRWDESVALYERGRVASTRAGDVVQAATAANNIGEVYSDQGRLDEAEAMFRDALATWQRAPFPVGIWLATSNLGRAAARAGRFAEALESLDRAREGFAAIGADGYVAEARTRQVECYVLAADTARAEHLATDTTERIRRIGGLGHLGVMMLRLRGCLAAQCGDDQTALELLREAEAASGRAGYLYERALTLQVLGQLLPGTDGNRYRTESTELLARLGVVSIPHLPLPVPSSFGAFR